MAGDEQREDTVPTTIEVRNRREQMREVPAYQFIVLDLVLIDVYGPEGWDFEAWAGEDWGVVLCDEATAGDADPFCATDFEGTTSGDPQGMNVLILADDLPAWQKVADWLGCTLVEVAGDVAPGHYGDGGWEGVDIATIGEGAYATAYWIEQRGF